MIQLNEYIYKGSMGEKKFFKKLIGEEAEYDQHDHKIQQS